MGVSGVWSWNKSASGIELTTGHPLDENNSTGSPGVKVTEALSQYDKDWDKTFFQVVIFRQCGKGSVEEGNHSNENRQSLGIFMLNFLQTQGEKSCEYIR